ncbi:trans-sulfuration enzyme family protein [Tuanshanicoccus lijuaniae]|uniref:trans-sulfuration enzyme family protein n=1 Tax=Aerococcaceae bacterium zg-1292 TaxID=2774330 RepID=UPI001BD8B69C|nr:aminotransferase class I/II-fold pyridoxal phosphate-dependent enzyme [Aerococcaceae bacterium zg-BR22]MBS4455505.1 aminotransferase class I/II-fold pyridoxal phosphate-dependent enzyme [Aerococcaceae bacterium zg-A91]MBS4457124.1 aminotransferase class I/II-fold pyridoxal phosphate-dependent enzyme [Aerococcaceae bacterium zg-BR33]
MEINTKLLHDYPVICKYTGATSIPKFQTSTFDQQEICAENIEYMYTRFKNPTVEALDEAMKMLSSANFALTFASGMAAISTGLLLLKSGEHVIIPKEVYGGTFQFVSKVLTKLGIEVSYVDMSEISNIENCITENTRMIYVETPSNPLLKITDIVKVVNLAKKYNLLTMADNTFMTNLYQSPLELGVDVVCESLTKFINGHSDVTGGMLATNNEQLFNEMKLLQKNLGSILGVEDAWLVLRGMKTMGLRMTKSVENAKDLAYFLHKHPKVKKVYYPGLPSHEASTIHKSQAKSGGAVLSFELFSEKGVRDFTKYVKIPVVAVSLGGVESILSYPKTMSHAVLSPEERLDQGVTDELLRLSCGVEDIEDLISDFEQALNKI